MSRCKRAVTHGDYPAITQIAMEAVGRLEAQKRRKLLLGIKKAARLDRSDTTFGGAGGSRTPVRKYSAVGTTCLGPSLALATQCRTGTIKSSEPIIFLAIQCKGDPSRDPVSVAPAQTHRQIRNGVELQN